ncbi:glutathione transferase [Aureococcus anophagefferens]|uniref:Glutathione transferase n=1 Tax=Aureococcus anophagefferens TaxID=44056 RepID=A0ABR1GB05_AURAN
MQFASTAAAPCETEKPFWIVARQSGSVQRDLPIFATKAGAVSLRAEGPGRVTRRDFAEGIFVLDSVLRDDECDEIIEMSEAMGYASDAPASLRPCRAATVEAVRRNANVTWIVDDALNDAVFARAKRLLPPTIDLQTRDGVDFSLGPVAGLNRRWRLYRYGENDDLHDGRRHSWLSFLIYLNDDFAGGETKFALGGEVSGVAPKKGSVLCFLHGHHPFSPLHEGALVDAGTKYVARTDVLYEMPPWCRGTT